MYFSTFVKMWIFVDNGDLSKRKNPFILLCGFNFQDVPHVFNPHKAGFFEFFLLWFIQ